MRIAVDPNFATNHYVYLQLHAQCNGHHPGPQPRRARHARGDRAVAGSEKLIFRLNSQSGDNHQGPLDFRNAGKLYVSTGTNATPDNAQHLAKEVGELLRIKFDGYTNFNIAALSQSRYIPLRES